MKEYMNSTGNKKRRTGKRVFFLHVNILLFSFTGIFSKLAANNVNTHGIFHYATIIYIVLMFLNCGIYALFWQQSLKHFDVNVAFSHRVVYIIWSLLWAHVVFTEDITIGNIIGAVLIVGGVLLVQHEH